jgi:hypothetical protein
MAEEKEPAVEARRIVGQYLNGLKFSTLNVDWAAGKLVPSRDKARDIDIAEEMRLDVDEKFGNEVDVHRKDGSDFSKAVIREIVRLLDKRTDLSFIGRRIVNRIKDEDIKEDENII